MRKGFFFIIFIFCFSCIILFSEVLILKNDKVINGKIIKLDEDTMTIYSIKGEYIIDREDIKVIYRNYEIYKKTIENNNVKKEDSKEKEGEISVKEELSEEKKKINNLIINGDFESGNYYTERGFINLIWSLDAYNYKYSDLEFRNGMAVIYVKNNKDESVNFHQKGILLEKGKKYVFEFQAKSITPVVITVNFQHYGMKTPIYYLNKNIRLTDKIKDFKYEFKMLHETNHNARLDFRVNTKLRVVYIDNVKLYEKRK